MSPPAFTDTTMTVAVSTTPSTRNLRLSLLLICIILFSSNLNSANAVDESAIVGIDLGTSFSKLATCSKSDWHQCVMDTALAPGNAGKLASTIGCEDGKFIVGAKSSILRAVKRILGLRWADKDLQDYIKRTAQSRTFNIVNDNGNVLIEFTCGSQVLRKPPMFFSAAVLYHIRAKWEKTHPKKHLNKAVLSVPAHFSDARRRATIEAARIAGFTVMRLISEPVAAGILFLLNDFHDVKFRHALVFDFGGGTLDVAVLKPNFGTTGATSLREVLHSSLEAFDILSTYGDNFLGGEDIDRIIVNHCVSTYLQTENANRKFADRIAESTLRSNTRFMTELQVRAEELKIRLTFAEQQDEENSFTVTPPSSLPSMRCALTPAKLDQLLESENILKRCEDVIVKALALAKISKADVDYVLPTGGTSLSPFVPKLLARMFGEEKVISARPDDSAAAMGCATVAAVMQYSGSKALKAPFKIISDVTSLNLGTDVLNTLNFSRPLFSVIIPKGSKLPVSQQQSYSAVRDYQTRISASVYEGEAEHVEDSVFLDEFIVDMEPVIQSESAFNITFTLDINGILNVKVEGQNLGMNQSTILAGAFYKELTTSQLNAETKSLEGFFKDTSRASPSTGKAAVNMHTEL